MLKLPLQHKRKDVTLFLIIFFSLFKVMVYTFLLQRVSCGDATAGAAFSLYSSYPWDIKHINPFQGHPNN